VVAVVRGVDVFHRLMAESEWGFGEKTPNRKHVKRGDSVVFYISSGSGAYSHSFLGVAKIAKDPVRVAAPKPVLIEKVNIRDSPIHVPLGDVEVWDQGVAIQPLISRLTFIKNPDSWGVYLQGGVRKISKQDFQEIVTAAQGRGVVSQRELRQKTYELIWKRPAQPVIQQPRFPKLIAERATYQLARFSREEDLEEVVVKYAKEIFGDRTIYFDLKRKIQSKTDIAGIPDGYLLDLTDLSPTSFFLVENELESHDVFSHIVPQVMRFSRAFDHASKRKILRLLYDEIKSNEDLRLEFEKLVGEKDLYKVLDEIIYSDFGIVIVIDRSIPQLTDIRSTLEGIAAEVRIIELKRFSTTSVDEPIFLVDTP
ncbi:MAG: EVE domain-containing protein, partial [Candidatus Geothermarchaeales archaeon]